MAFNMWFTLAQAAPCWWFDSIFTKLWCHKTFQRFSNYKILFIFELFGVISFDDGLHFIFNHSFIVTSIFDALFEESSRKCIQQLELERESKLTSWHVAEPWPDIKREFMRIEWILSFLSLIISLCFSSFFSIWPSFLDLPSSSLFPLAFFVSFDFEL